MPSRKTEPCPHRKQFGEKTETWRCGSVAVTDGTMGAQRAALIGEGFPMARTVYSARCFHRHKPDRFPTQGHGGKQRWSSLS
jgi:hypothetical protein